MSLFADARVFADARCVERWDLFDDRVPDETDDDRAYRHAAAIALCTGCPCRRPCTDLAATQPVRGAVEGVWAGRVYTGREQRRTQAAS